MADDTKTDAGRKVLTLKRAIDVDKILASRQARVRQGVEIEIRGDAAPSQPAAEARSPSVQKPMPEKHASAVAPIVRKPSLTDQEKEARKEALAKASAFLANSRDERREREEQRLRDQEAAKKQEMARKEEREVAVEAPRRVAPAPQSVKKHYNKPPFKQQNHKKTYSQNFRPRPYQRGGQQRRDSWNNRQQQPFQGPALYAERASLKGKTTTKKAFVPPTGVQKTVEVSGDMSVRSVALALACKSKNITDWLRDMGVKAGEQTVLDVETVCMVVEAMGHCARVTVVTEESLLRDMLPEPAEKTDARPPVLAIMGHVDHGKTTLVDALCHTRRAAKEAGGITQDVRGYQADLPGGGTMTLVDTPGHAAFKNIRARGAKVVDIVLLIIAADDSVQPQTEEAIEYLKTQNIPFIVTVTKMDKVETAQPVINDLMRHSIVPEALGGEHLFVEISAEKKTGLDELCQLIALKAEELKLRACNDAPARGVVLDAYVSKGLGVVSSVLVQDGTLKVSDHVVVDTAGAKVRALRDVSNKAVKQARPSEIVTLVGLADLPSAGSLMLSVLSAQNVKTLVDWRLQNNAKSAPQKERAFDWAKMEGDTKLPLVLKGDAQGSVEALELVLKDMTCDEWSTDIVRADVGPVTSSTIDFAHTTGASVVAFNTVCERGADTEAKKQDVKLFESNVIYTLEKQVYEHLKSLRAPKYEYVVLGKGNIIQVFDIAKYGRVAGCAVQEGVMRLGMQARFLRDGVEICVQKITSLYKEKDKMKEVAVGNNCGIFLEGFEGFDVGDTVECVEVRRVDN